MHIENVVIIIPTYNEAQIIEETLFQLFQATAHITDKYIQVLVFDSASQDNTQEIVRSLQASNPRLYLQTEPQKSGLGSAYMQAMRFALNEMAADIIVEFDADLSHQPQYIAPMLEKMNHHDVVIGSRYVPGGSIPADWGWNRKALSILGNYIARCFLGKKYRDYTSGFRMTRHTLLRHSLPEFFLSAQYGYKLQLFWLLHKNNARIFEYPITFIDRMKGQSKIPTNSIFDSLRVLFLLRFYDLIRPQKKPSESEVLPPLYEDIAENPLERL
ncbi:MAG: polyprenol monophosphomannose synthase [Legionellaceae bacterium]|nr:polyprenol monophosphomannose synthase [Legionellaceae bacterium]